MSSTCAETSLAFDARCQPLQLEVMSASKWTTVDFEIQYQQKTNWCWAALAVSVAKFYDTSFKHSQCDIANGELGRSDCCETSKDDPCNVYGHLMSSLHRVEHFEEWHVRRPSKSKNLQEQIRRYVQTEIKQEIDDGRPLCGRIIWAGGGAHFLAIYGYATDSELSGVAIADPWWGLSDLDWEDFPIRYRTGAVYTDTYYTSGS
jgi:hypothetical protein